MSKRQQRRETGSSWVNSEVESTSLEDVVIEGYGLNLKPSIRIVARPIALAEIRPSPHQPRRAFPSAIRERMNNTSRPYDANQLLRWWVDAVPEIDVMAVLESRDDFPRPEQPDALMAGLLNLLDLAATIRREGLTNPITVIRQDSGYVIETGERRWLAYHLLNMAYGGTGNVSTEWAEIPARVMDSFDLWRQATENSARDDLNAIARARQLALLLMDLHGMENFRPISAFAHEQDFYAQVADGDEYRIPRGKGEMLINATGLQNDSQLRRYRALLRLPREYWDYADDNNLTEGEIRDASSTGYTVPRGTVSKPEKPAKKSMIDRTYLYYSRRRLQKLPSSERRYVRQRIEEIAQILDSLGYDD